jgi:hypothetical protein
LGREFEGHKPERFHQAGTASGAHLDYADGPRPARAPRAVVEDGPALLRCCQRSDAERRPGFQAPRDLPRLLEARPVVVALVPSRAGSDWECRSGSRLKFQDIQLRRPSASSSHELRETRILLKVDSAFRHSFSARVCAFNASWRGLLLDSRFGSVAGVASALTTSIFGSASAVANWERASTTVLADRRSAASQPAQFRDNRRGKTMKHLPAYIIAALLFLLWVDVLFAK